MGTGNPGVSPRATLTLTHEYPNLQLGSGYSTGTGMGLVGFHGYKGCITGYGLFEENMVIYYKINHYLRSEEHTSELQSRP